ncbi:MAG: precorrin-2 C20-methyltransferase/cobalt-factor C20-methyltransferase [Herbinix sp.]|nr:precorrin-2 C20-methyltransferase/cobalt-factor C20-methyltransferase [Herbinix sp.]
MTGKLYGIGVGPGDPELLTLKAVRLMSECDIIALPNKSKETCVAYEIAKGAYPEIETKECLFLEYPMTKDKLILAESRKRNEEQVVEKLDEGKVVVFLTLGDPTIYSTYMYLDKTLRAKGYEAEIVSGIPSFCAIGAALGISLGEAEDEIHIIPATYGLTESMELPGTKILMKAGTKLKEIKEIAMKYRISQAIIQQRL